jgi:hypothetical protein
MELLDAAFSPVNLLPTLLLTIVLVYWVFVMVGLLDLHIVDLHLDVHAESHHDVDVHVDGLDVSFLNNALAFFNLGHIPLMVFLSFLILPMWILSILANYYTGNTQIWLSFAFLLPNLVVSLFVAKILTMPFIKVFSALSKENDIDEIVIGKMCTILIPASEDKIGQASVKIDGAPLMLNIKTTAGKMLEKGKSGLVIDYNSDRNIYTVEPYEI